MTMLLLWEAKRSLALLGIVSRLRLGPLGSSAALLNHSRGLRNDSIRPQARFLNQKGFDFGTEDFPLWTGR